MIERLSFPWLLVVMVTIKCAIYLRKSFSSTGFGSAIGSLMTAVPAFGAVLVVAGWSDVGVASAVTMSLAVLAFVFVACLVLCEWPQDTAILFEQLARASVAVPIARA